MKKRVILTDTRTEEMQEAAGFLAQQGYDVNIIPHTVCLWHESEVRAWAETVEGEIAGVIHPLPPAFLSPLLTTTEEDYARARDEGPLAAWCVTRVLCDRLREQRDGSMIYVGSIHAEKPMGHGFLFSADYGAVQMLSREVSQDYGPFGVRTFFVQRGPSERDPDLRNDLSNVYYGLEKRYPSRSMPGCGEMKELLAFLLTRAAAPLSGSDLRCDGGMTLYYGERITEEQANVLFARQRMEQEASIIGEV